MSVRLIFRSQEYEVRPGIGLREALAKLGIPGESVLATRDGEMITDDEILSEGEVIRLIAVISGG
jgi:sulfur carrier protein ThiS